MLDEIQSQTDFFRSLCRILLKMAPKMITVDGAMISGKEVIPKGTSIIDDGFLRRTRQLLSQTLRSFL